MIVVFGSINLDLVTHVERIPGPGETVIGPSYTHVPGGKGANQALAAKRAGATVRMVGATGLDDFADIALSLLLSDGVDLTGVVRTAQPTGAAFISVDSSGQNAITVAAGANATARAAQVEGLPIEPGDSLLLQREVPDQEGEIAARSAKARGARVILNLAPAGAVSTSYLAELDILVMNEHETAVLSAALDLGDEPAALARHLHERHGVDMVLTLGADGAAGWQGGVEHRVASLPIVPVDTTGAGDTFLGAFAAALDAGLDFKAALGRGAAAGSLACTKQGAQPSIPTKDDIDRAIATL
ncbi:ribokinase [Lichenihabitans psoromatis]|uniref:ribokinase n=1 Tax=Lichenihabitans psoromatis TaxID=2528642 RepID=UPI0010385B4A|nr:ribokinase [Lichenihabitans psoromatis]